MSIRIELPGPGDKWVDVKEPGELNSGDRRKVKAAVQLRIDPETGEQVIPGDYNDRMNNKLAALVITGWNLQWKLPKGDASVLDNLTMEQLDFLIEALADHVAAINKDGKEDAEDPTEPAS